MYENPLLLDFLKVLSFVISSTQKDFDYAYLDLLKQLENFKKALKSRYEDAEYLSMQSYREYIIWLAGAHGKLIPTVSLKMGNNHYVDYDNPYSSVSILDQIKNIPTDDKPFTGHIGKWHENDESLIPGEKYKKDKK